MGSNSRRRPFQGRLPVSRSGLKSVEVIECAGFLLLRFRIGWDGVGPWRLAVVRYRYVGLCILVVVSRLSTAHRLCKGMIAISDKDYKSFAGSDHHYRDCVSSGHGNPLSPRLDFTDELVARR